LLIVVYNTFWDLDFINAIERWKDHCKISECWIDELWAASTPRFKYWLHALNQFDYVFTGHRDNLSALSQVVDRPCTGSPLGSTRFDSARFLIRQPALLTCTVSGADTKESIAKCSRQQSGESFSMCMTRLRTPLK
jgi:hypothetical protein